MYGFLTELQNYFSLWAYGVSDPAPFQPALTSPSAATPSAHPLTDQSVNGHSSLSAGASPLQRLRVRGHETLEVLFRDRTIDHNLFTCGVR
jgi:hypothetical protein